MPNTAETTSLRSEEVQDLLTAVPVWMIRWGNSLFLFLILGVLTMSYLLKYPDTIASEALITTELPPQKIYARTTGYIDTILVADNQIVGRNTPVAIMENTAHFEDVLLLKFIMDTMDLKQIEIGFPDDKVPFLFLGEINPSYNLFVNELHLKKKSHPGYRKLVNAFMQLHTAIQEWESKYVLTAKIIGKVSFRENRVKNSHVQSGDLLFTISPHKNENLIARLKAPGLNSGKIKKGQKVNLRLNRYPEADFGILQGNVKDISPWADEDGFYTVDVDLPSRIITTFGVEIKFAYDMKATAEIITEELRLIERFFYRLKDILD